MRERKGLVRSIVAMASIAVLAGALGSTPGMALSGTDKKQVRKIAKKIVNKAIAKHEGGGGGGGTCPSGTRRYGTGCIEETNRPNAQWFAAAKTCADLGRRLPKIEELDGFRLLSGITLANNEWSSDVDFDSILFGVQTDDAGNTDRLDASSLAQYRCAANLT